MAVIQVANLNEHLGSHLDGIQVFPILGDGNCFFRGIAQWEQDPLREREYTPVGTCRNQKAAMAENKRAQELRKNIVKLRLRPGLPIWHRKALSSGRRL